MSSLEIRVDAWEMGVDPTRLERIQTHFDAYVADRRLAGWLATVSRGGELVWTGKAGHRNREKGLEVTDDTIWRMYSMTKPITSIAVMMLYEEGLFDLTDDAGKWIEELQNPRVYLSGPPAAPTTTPATEPVRIHHLLSHTSGLTYGFQNTHPVDAIYRAKGYEWGYPKGADLEQLVHDACTSPLVFQPGSAWNYSVATDVLGRLVEIWSGQPLDVFFRERILSPLGMNETDWQCGEGDRDRLSMLYMPHKGSAIANEAWAESAMHPPQLLSGGGGLLSTAHDYNRFMKMLLGAGELDGVRLVSSRTLELMTQNHLPGNLDLEEFATGLFAETDFAGIGFGLGFSVVTNRIANKSLTSEGSFAWGGAASTAFWVDPVEDLTVGFFTQLLPSSTYPIRRELQRLVYQALVD
jgi:CubicO group peptidase (beta-lactamase class C family)